jgi:four helix bundle protein
MDVEKLKVWQHSMDLAAKVYEITDKFPKHEMYSLADQMRRAAVSIPSNIAEGKGRRTTKDFIHFLYVARGSLNELSTQIKLAKRIGYLTPEDY